MASSKVMASSTSRNSDLRRRRSSSSSTKSSISDRFSTNLHHHHHRLHCQHSNTTSDSMTVDGLLRSVYDDNPAASDSTLLDAEITLLDAAGAVTAISDTENTPTIRRHEGGGKTVEEVWDEIVAGNGGRREGKQEEEELMTLEDFLARAGAVEEQEVKVEPMMLGSERLSDGLFSFDSIPASPFPGQSVDGLMGFGNGVEVVGGRGRKRALLEPLDKAAQQRQRRMIKNRESAARSRERKQAYLMELESLAMKLEEENERLLKEKEQRTRERYKQLLETVIPVEEHQRPPRVLRRVRSMNW